MKQIVCGVCNDFRALSPRKAVTCRCGNVTGWWTDSQRGIAKVRATDKELVRILGMHNGFLQFAFDDYLTDKGRDEKYRHWRNMHKAVIESSEGYIFGKHACPFAIFRVGDTSDVSWATDEEQPPE